MGVRKDIVVEGNRIEKAEEEREEGIIMKKARIGGEVWRMVGVDVNGDMERKLHELKKWMEEGRQERVIVEGDFNARTGEQRGRVGNEEEEETGRKSKAKKSNKEGWKLLQAIEEVEMEIMNWSVCGDEGEFTYIGGKGETVIDYVIRGKEVREKIERMEVGERIDSDHQPITVYIRDKGTEKKSKSEEIRERKVWDKTEEGKGRFKEETEIIELEGIEVNERIEELKKKLEEIKGKNGKKRRK